ncbi:hypothetical protein RND81_04G049600 [Saponaria officinalis]|uniref:Uncharacterized protein n=1 Tax=Saponaria officinalis TaxID=3572 RepID=A0AAW1LGJ8_SAPOF
MLVLLVMKFYKCTIFCELNNEFISKQNLRTILSYYFCGISKLEIIIFIIGLGYEFAHAHLPSLISLVLDRVYQVLIVVLFKFDSFDKMTVVGKFVPATGKAIFIAYVLL